VNQIVLAVCFCFTAPLLVLFAFQTVSFVSSDSAQTVSSQPRSNVV